MSRVFVRPVVIALFVYLISLGATFNGIFTPEISALTLGMLAILAACWLIIRWRRGWTWYRSPLDGVFILWVIAFSASLIANWDAARRIAIGLWYVSLYIGVWYVLHDALANRLLTRDMLVDALLVSGFIITVIGYWQLASWLTTTLKLHLGFNPPRPVSLFGNPNFLSAFLVVLIPFIASRLVLAKQRFQRIFLGIYALLTLALLLLTFSRAAWVGMAAGAVVWILLMLAQNGLLSKNALLAWWAKQSRLLKTLMLSGAGLMLGAGVILTVIFIRSLSQGGRSADLRGDIYQAAVELFAEKPLTGQGLFTFGRGLVRLPDVQPDKPHSHAHNAVLQIAAELGIVGLIALAGTLWVMARVMRDNWRGMTARERILLAGAIGAVVAFAGDQLGDLPAMMPAIALAGLIGLFLALASSKPISIQWRRGFPVGIAVLWGIVLVTGFWSSRIYGQYLNVLSDAVSSHAYQSAAERLQPIIDSDPNLSLYSMEQAFLLGMEASKGNSDAARRGIAVYGRFIALDPSYALGWANRAALNWQLGEQNAALKDIRQAITLGSNVWQYQLVLARYAEAMGDSETANQAYDRILQLYPDASLYPDLDALAVRRGVSNRAITLSIPAQIVLLLESDQSEQAVQLWQQHPLPETTSSDVLQILLALSQNDQTSALSLLSRAEALIPSPADEAWVHLGRSRIAGFIGQTDLASDELAQARQSISHKPLDADDKNIINIAYAQFLRFAIPRLFLPQVDYHIDDPVLLHLLAE